MNALPQPPFSDREPAQARPVLHFKPPHRKRILAWVAGILATLIVLVAASGIALLHSQRFHAYLQETVQTKATAALGNQVRLHNVVLGWQGGGPVVELDGIVIDGAPPHISPPLFEADSLRVQVTISSFLKRTWYVNDLRLEHPVARVLSDRDNRTNLPTTKSSGNSESSTNVFDLGVRHLLIERGEIYYNDLKSDLAADVRDLSLQTRFDSSQTRYRGVLGYKDGHLRFETARPIAHNLEARFAATPKQFVMESAVLSTESSRLSLSATVDNYSQPVVHAQYQAWIDTQEFRQALNKASLPIGSIQTSGTIEYQSDPNRPFLRAAKVTGEVYSPHLRASYEKSIVNIFDFAAHYALADGNASVEGIRATILGGQVRGILQMRDLAGATQSSAALHVSGLSVRGAQNLLAPATSSQAAIQGFLNAEASAKWGKTLDDFAAQSRVTLQARMQPGHGGPDSPVNVLIRAKYSARGQILSLAQSYLRTPQTAVFLDGTVSQQSSLNVRMVSRELHELETLAAGFQSQPSSPLDLHGQATLTAAVSGSTRNPHIRGQLSATNLKVRGTSWRLLETSLSASPNGVQLDGGQLIPTTHGRINFQFATALRDWAFTPSSAFQVRLTATALNAGELAKAAGVTMPVSGTLSANVEGSGTEIAPVGNGTIELSGARIADEPVRAASLRFQGNGTSVNVKLKTDLTAGSAIAEVTYEPKSQAYQGSVRAVGIKLDQLEAIKRRNLPLTGVLNASANGRGTVQNPGLQASIEIPRLDIRDQTINGLRLTADVRNHAANLTFASQLLGTEARGRGTVQLTGDYPSNFAFDTDTVSLEPVVALFAPEQAPNLAGQTELHATFLGPLKRKTAVEAHLIIPKLTLNYKHAIQLDASPIHADYANGTLDVKRAVIRGTGTELTFQANVPASKDAPASLLLRGNIDLRLAQMLSPDITSGGELQFNIDSFGALSDPNVQGQVRLVHASLAEVGLPVGLRDGNGILTLTRDRLDITQFQGNVGGGTVTARGGVTYRPNLSFDLGMKADGVRVLYQQSIRTILGSRLALTGQYDNALLQGQVNIEQLSFTSSFDLMNFASQFGGGATTPPPTGDFTGNLHLQVAIQTPGGLNLSSRELSLAGSANLQLRGTAADPVILGRVNLTDGDLIFSGNRYLVDGGTIDFRNPSRTEPVIDLSASTTIQQYNIQMHFWGPADHMHTNYASDPALPPADVINLIAFGKTSEAAAANPTPPGSLGAESLLASQVSSQVTSRVEKLAGISQLSIDPVLGSSRQSPGARIAIQQRVTSKVFVTFSADMTSTQQQAVKLEYQMNRRASFSAVRDQNGGFSFQTSFRKVW